MIVNYGEKEVECVTVDSQMYYPTIVPSPLELFALIISSGVRNENVNQVYLFVCFGGTGVMWCGMV